MRGASGRAFGLALCFVAAAGCARQQTTEKQQETDMTASGPVQGPAGTLHVDDGGTGGLPVIFLHSYAGSSAHWANQLAHLRPTRRALAIDFRGHGQSTPPDSNGWSVDSLATDIAAVVDAKGLERFVLVGHSMGGSAAIAYAGAHPERVAGLVVVGTPGQTPPEQSQQVLSSLEANYDTVSAGYWRRLLANARPEVGPQLEADIGRVPREASMAIFRALFAYDPMPAFNRYMGPKLIIDTPHGDTPTSIHNLAPGVAWKVIEGTSHWPHLDKPDEFNAMLDEFLAGVQ
jgi:pimeloyl-ACP methyl ester carboxylesterase